MAVLTNKPVRPRGHLRCPGLAPYFLNIYGGNISHQEPNRRLLALMSEAGAKPEETVMIATARWT